ncbi:hypothetical protein FE784_18130 [Paenibacillus hemerocallicola]|uniref:Glycosyl hydrolases family 39 N-terminal catalytic domain-containing protein n=2 Tax=Paenibacillus hemerocallicola TaxID=1172614 RepID=A0A5C4T8V1_9BACL|nr:hypothetical protein FE784_18130 [Paenibacillus hemerocallicola]
MGGTGRMTANIRIDFSEKLGAVKALQGVNNGPLCYGNVIDVTHSYKELAVPWVRIHDPNWPHPLEVDIHTIFPDFSADPEDPASYRFERTDRYIQSIVDTGARIVYRLGESIEHFKRWYCYPPEDNNKWAAICRGIVKHYNMGWADGFHHGIQYWEIWNEVENEKMWPGTPEQFYELYRAASTVLRALDPELKIGGYACGGGVFNQLTFGFLDYCRTHGLPLDFLSWHVYPNNPLRPLSMGKRVRAMLDEYGFTAAESHLNEWNYLRFPPGASWKTMWTDEYVKQDILERGKGPEGASFAAATLIALQDADVDVANYYDGQPSSIFCGLFNCYGVPQKTFYAFRAIRELGETGERALAEWEHGRDDLYACAAVHDSGKKAMVLISNFSDRDNRLRLAMNGLAEGAWIIERYALDEANTMKLVATGMEKELELRIPRYGVLQVKLTKV